MFSSFICPGGVFLPAAYGSIYYCNWKDVTEYTLCGLCYKTCLDDVERSQHTLFYDSDNDINNNSAAFSCNCDKVHNRLENGVYKWGIYDCAKCTNCANNTNTEARSFNMCGCDVGSKMSTAKHCPTCSLIKGSCKCGNNMANVDYEYLRTYFCMGLGVQLNGYMTGFDLVLYNLAKNRIASELGGYKRHPDTLERKEKKSSREMSHFALVEILEPNAIDHGQESDDSYDEYGDGYQDDYQDDNNYQGEEYENNDDYQDAGDHLEDEIYDLWN